MILILGLVKLTGISKFIIVINFYMVLYFFENG